MAELSHAVRTIFAELLEQLATAPPAGSVYVRPRDGIDYLYARVRVGAGRSDRFLGRASDPTAIQSADRYRRGAKLAAQRRKTITLLTRSGLGAQSGQLGTILDALAAAGLFKKGAVVIGTAAYQMSEALVGSTLPAPTMMTEDLDVATANLTISAEPEEPLVAILRKADPSFWEIPQLDMRAPASRFSTEKGFKVDVVTPLRHRDDRNPLRLRALQAGAAPLQYLAWLIKDSVPSVALWGDGVPVLVPQPARFAVHKLILAQKRNPGTFVKRHKDLQQATALITALETENPFALEDAFADARARGKRGWAEPIARSLQEIGRTDLLD